MAELYANPYDITAQGFYFDSTETFTEKMETTPWEECSIEYIDGDNPKLFEAAGIHQGNLENWFDELDHLADMDDETYAIRYLLDCGYDIETACERADEVQVFKGRAEDYAAELLEECYELDKLPEIIRYHIDFDGIAHDMELNSEIHEIEHDVWVVNCLEF